MRTTIVRSGARTRPVSRTRALSAVRTAVGGAMIAAPRQLPRTLGVDAATVTRTTWLVRMIGVREVALGAGTLLAARRGEAMATWVLAQAFSDAGDAVVIGVALRSRRVASLPALAVIGFALGGAALGVRTALGDAPNAARD